MSLSAEQKWSKSGSDRVGILAVLLQNTAVFSEFNTVVTISPHLPVEKYTYQLLGKAIILTKADGG